MFGFERVGVKVDTVRDFDHKCFFYLGTVTRRMETSAVAEKKGGEEIEEGESSSSSNSCPHKAMSRSLVRTLSENSLVTDSNKGHKRRKLCSMGTGEIVHIVAYSCLPGKMEAFEEAVQDIARSLYEFKCGITDVRVCHPRCGQVCFVLTFLSRKDLERFEEGPQAIAETKMFGIGSPRAAEAGSCRDRLRGFGPCATQDFSATGTLMPACHTLSSLLTFLRANVVGKSHGDHNVREISREMAKWYPRPSEYKKYVHWNKKNPKAYTRNLIFHNDNMDVILMCWPAGAVSTIHDHDESSCWVVVVEGEAYEIQYTTPCVDRKFIESEMKNPTGARGRCGPLRQCNEAKLTTFGVTSTYANNEIGIHRIENRSKNTPALTLHVYAPPLEKLKIYDANTNEVHVHSVSAQAFESIDGEVRTGLDVDGWNFNQCCRFPHRSPIASPLKSSLKNAERV